MLFALVAFLIFISSLNTKSAKLKSKRRSTNVIPQYTCKFENRHSKLTFTVNAKSFTQQTMRSVFTGEELSIYITVTNSQHRHLICVARLHLLKSMVQS